MHNNYLHKATPDEIFFSFLNVLKCLLLQARRHGHLVLKNTMDNIFIGSAVSETAEIGRDVISYRFILLL